MEYTPYYWYWQSTNGRIYSSAKQALIQNDDNDFIAWQTAGYLPTPWPKNEKGEETDAALANVLAPHGLRLFPPTLDEIKTQLKLEVDAAAENERLKYITKGVGQSMTYQEKVNQASDYSKKYAAHKANPDKMPTPKDDDYPLLKASLGIDGDTLIEVAETVIFAYANWQQIGAAIEATRLETKEKIANAKNEAAAQATFEAVKWPNPAIS